MPCAYTSLVVIVTRRTYSKVDSLKSPKVPRSGWNSNFVGIEIPAIIDDDRIIVLLDIQG